MKLDLTDPTEMTRLCYRIGAIAHMVQDPRAESPEARLTRHSREDLLRLAVIAGVTDPSPEARAFLFAWRPSPADVIAYDLGIACGIPIGEEEVAVFRLGTMQRGFEGALAHLRDLPRLIERAGAYVTATQAATGFEGAEAVRAELDDLHERVGHLRTVLDGLHEHARTDQNAIVGAAWVDALGTIEERMRAGTAADAGEPIVTDMSHYEGDAT